MMITATTPTVEKMGRILAHALRENAAVQALYGRHHREVFAFWVVTDPISTAERYRIRELLDLLYEQYPGISIELHVENASFYDIDPRDYVFEAPPGAEPIPLR